MTLDELDDLEGSVHTVPPYDDTFGDDRLCACGHAYYRHFDTYDDMYPCGCKYCECHVFTMPATEDV